MKKRIVLCADDYGQTVHISQAIICLVQENRLSATSCMVNSPEWQTHAQWLLPFAEKIDIGLHFNLTEGTPLSTAFKEQYGPQLIPVSDLLRRAFTRRLNKAVLIAECHAQLDSFLAAMGKAPDFIDGHQHVHQFPQIRKALLEVYQARGLTAYMRAVNPAILSGGWGNAWKKAVIRATGSQPLQALLRARKIPHNASFAGIYDFSQFHGYAGLFKGFLSEISDLGLIMCHPALKNSSDSIAEARNAEYLYLSGPEFVVDCAVSSVQLGRLPRAGSFNV